MFQPSNEIPISNVSIKVFSQEKIKNIKGFRKYIPKTRRKHQQEERMKQMNERQVLEYKMGLIPKIFRTDSRRSYASMFANVYNARDFDFMMNYMNTFAADKFLYIFKQTVPNQPNLHVQLEGIIPTGKIWFARMYDSPDMVFNIVTTKLRARADETSVIEINFIITGTKVVNIKVPPDQPLVHGCKTPNHSISFDTLSFDNESVNPTSNLLHGIPINMISSVIDENNSLSTDHTFDNDSTSSCFSVPSNLIIDSKNQNDEMSDYLMVPYRTTGVVNIKLNEEKKFQQVEMILTGLDLFVNS